MTTEPDVRLDLGAGVPVGDVAEGGMVAGRVGEDDVILVRGGGSLFAIGAQCTHYSGPLAQGLVVGQTIRCPWHHACFSLRTGEAVRAPALDAISCWRVEEIGGKAFVREKLDALRPGASEVAMPKRTVAKSAAANASGPEAIVIIGGGAAGLAAADVLRRAGYQRKLTMVSADNYPPCDRPNLSKDYLAGTASEDWIPLRPPEFYGESAIELLLDTRARSIDLAQRRVLLDGGKELAFDALLLATGADPVRIDIPGAQASRVHTLRSFADSRAIVAKAASARRVVVVGASFIGLEVAAALRTRGIEVHVVGRDKVPMERVLGADVGRLVQTLHESHGVVFHLNATVDRMDGAVAMISDGTSVEADFIVMGVGVRPSIALAEQAGLAMDRGVVVDEYLQTSAPGVYAAGDIARWPDRHSGERIRVEHWVVAERQGQVAARNLLANRPEERRRFDAVPFFWSQHYDLAINYVGHAESFDSAEIEGSLSDHDCAVSYKRGGRTLAVATISRDVRSLQAEAAMEMEINRG